MQLFILLIQWKHDLRYVIKINPRKMQVKIKVQEYLYFRNNLSYFQIISKISQTFSHTFYTIKLYFNIAMKKNEISSRNVSAFIL